MSLDEFLRRIPPETIAQISTGVTIMALGLLLWVWPTRRRRPKPRRRGKTQEEIEFEDWLTGYGDD